MKLIIAGSRTMDVGTALISYATIWFKLKPTEIVSGGATGVDTEGEAYAREHNLPIKQFIPDWKMHGKGAGPIRNRQMADYADAALVIWDGESRGAANMLMHARMAKIPVYEVMLRRQEPDDG